METVVMLQLSIPQTLFSDWWVEIWFKQHYEVMFTSNFKPTYCVGDLHSQNYISYTYLLEIRSWQAK